MIFMIQLIQFRDFILLKKENLLKIPSSTARVYRIIPTYTLVVTTSTYTTCCSVLKRMACVPHSFNDEYDGVSAVHTSVENGT